MKLDRVGTKTMVEREELNKVAYDENEEPRSHTRKDWTPSIERAAGKRASVFQRVSAATLSFLLLSLVVLNWNSSAIVVRLCPFWRLEALSGAAVLLAVAEAGAWLARRFRLKTAGTYAYAAFFITFAAALALALFAPYALPVLSPDDPQQLFVAHVILLFATLEYGLLGSVMFTFPVTAGVSAVIAGLHLQPGPSVPELDETLN